MSTRSIASRLYWSSPTRYLAKPAVVATRSISLSEDSAKQAPRRIKIYTKTGDKGTSSLYTGERRPKNDRIFDALGTADELNSFIGVARSFCTPSHALIAKHLTKVQSTILDLGSHIATPRTSAHDAKLARTRFVPRVTTELESWIDEIDQILPPLKNFVLPSGGKLSAHLHVCRSVTRRLERLLHPLAAEEEIDANATQFINRLSDYFFVAARLACQLDGETETRYHPGSALENDQPTITEPTGN